jgi:branched-subunit amino acid transport protein
VSPRDLLAIGAMALGVYLPKLLPVLLLGGRFSTPVRRWLGYVAPAVLGALVAPAILVSNGQFMVPGSDALGYITAFLVAVATRRMLPAVAAGLAVVLLTALVA